MVLRAAGSNPVTHPILFNDLQTSNFSLFLTGVHIVSMRYLTPPSLHASNEVMAYTNRAGYIFTVSTQTLMYL